MAKGHWSRDMATLWWRDKGSDRMRVSFHRDHEKLKAKYERLYHDKIDAALYGSDNKRIPLSALPMGGAKKKRREKAKPPKEPQPSAAAA
jgi:hypothetical protein